MLVAVDTTNGSAGAARVVGVGGFTVRGDVSGVEPFAVVAPALGAPGDLVASVEFVVASPGRCAQP